MTTNRKECQLALNKCQPQTLAEVVHCVARHSGINTNRLAEQLGTDYATFVRWTSPNGITTFPANRLALLAKLTGRFDALEWINADAGLIAAPRVSGQGADRMREILDAAEAFGELCAANRDAGTSVDPRERDSIIGRIRKLQRELAEFEQAIVAA
jgi:hypothetical protein